MQSVKRYSSTLLAFAGMLLLAGPIWPGAAHAQEQAPAAAAPAAPVQVASETMALDHVHLFVPDPAAAVAWYTKYLGAQPGPAGEAANNRVLFGKVRLIFAKADNSLPSQGSAIDFIGFSFPDVDAKFKEFQDAGIKIDSAVRDVPGMFKLGFIEDPWGTRIEIVQDPELLGFHHVHLTVPDPEVAFAWFLQNCGGTRGKIKGRLDAVNYGGVWLVIMKGDSVSSQGHVMNHLGFRTAMDIRAKVAELKAKGVTFTSEPADTPSLNLYTANFDGPEGVKIELIQRPN